MHCHFFLLQLIRLAGFHRPRHVEVPVQFLRYGLEPDSGGAGRWRGGLATAMEFRVFAPNTRITVCNRDRTQFRPWGILGGGPAEPSNLILNARTPRERVLGNTDIFVADPGDVIHIHSPGGGGHGWPLDREPGHVLAADVYRAYETIVARLEDLPDIQPDESVRTAMAAE
jgi:N-methylhydantoinase B